MIQIDRYIGDFTIMHISPRSNFGNEIWVCECKCGNTLELSKERLFGGYVSRCGCSSYEEESRDDKLEKILELLKIWSDMKGKCYDKEHPEYHLHGKLGIKIQKEWLCFKPFCQWAISSGYKNGMFLDRIDLDGHFTGQNCMWL